MRRSTTVLIYWLPLDVNEKFLLLRAGLVILFFMSLIEEALRRADGAITSSMQMAAPDRQNRGTRALMDAEGAAHILSLRSFFISGLIVSAGLLGWYLVWSGRMLHTSNSSPILSSVSAPQRIIPPTGMETSPRVSHMPRTARVLPAYRLSGIVLGPGTPMAVINDRILHLGDTINELRLTAVSGSGVTLERGMTRVTLRLGD